MSKYDQDGSERLQIWQEDNLIEDQVIGPGTNDNFLSCEISGIVVRITTNELDSDSSS